MAFFEKSSSKPVNPNFLSYSYSDTTLFNRGQWEKKNLSYFSSNYYYKITYPQGNDSGKLSYIDNNLPSVYRPTYFYIFSLLHNNITGLTSGDEADKTIIGELVIEHKNNNDHKLFLCILLKEPASTLGATYTNIDNVIKMIQSDLTKTSISDSTDPNKAIASIQLNLDFDIPKHENCIIYKDSMNANNTVIILTEPITLGSSDMSKLISKFENTTDLFSISAPNDYATQTSEVAASGAQSGQNAVAGDNSGDDIYIDCQPTGPGLEEIATYNIPIGSALSKDMQKLDLMKTSVNFFLFCLGLLLIYMGMPMLYKMLVIDKTIDNVQGDDARVKTVRSADLLIVIVFVLFIIGSFYYGFKGEGDFSMITNGLFVFVILGISISLIMVKKLDSDFNTHNNETINHNNNQESAQADSKGVLALLSGCFAYMLSVKGSLLHILVCDVIAVVILGSLYGAGTIDKPTFEKYCFNTLLIYIPVWVTLFIFLSSSGPVGRGARQALAGLATMVR